MKPRAFLFLAAATLLTIGALGVAGFLGSISSASFFNPPHWINWVHLGLGIVVLTIAIVGGKRLQAGVTLVATVAGLALGIGGLALGPYAARRYNVPELADPSDHIARLTVGLLALWAWLRRNRDITPPR